MVRECGPTHTLHEGEEIIPESSQLVDSAEVHDAVAEVFCGREKDNLQLKTSWVC